MTTAWDDPEVRAGRLARYLERRPRRFGAAHVPSARQVEVLDWAAGLPGDGVGGRSLYCLSATPGRGKTWALWRAGELLLAGGFRSTVEIVGAAEFQEACAPPTDTGRLRRWRTCGLLVLDDVGAFRVGPWVADNLYAVVSAREAGELPTAMSSNEKNVRDMLGEPVASRMAGALLVDFDTEPDGSPGVDFRRAGGGR